MNQRNVGVVCYVAYFVRMLSFPLRSHMAIVCSEPEIMMKALREEEPIPPSVAVLGIICLEDVIEMIIKEEISDETDLVSQMTIQRTQPYRTAKRSLSPRVLFVCRVFVRIWSTLLLFVVAFSV